MNIETIAIILFVVGMVAWAGLVIITIFSMRD